VYTEHLVERDVLGHCYDQWDFGCYGICNGLSGKRGRNEYGRGIGFENARGFRYTREER
jgi:hypothetical protein